MMAPPELPDPSENDLRPIEAPHVPFSDESDNEVMDHEGYERLPLDDLDFGDNQDDEERMNELNSQESQEQPDQTESNISTSDPNLPNIERAEVEIERLVWNAPRQEINITLDEERTAQILNAMSNITLPGMTLPEWADPEEKWKEDLLQRIRQRKEAQESPKDEQKT